MQNQGVSKDRRENTEAGGKEGMLPLKIEGNHDRRTGGGGGNTIRGGGDKGIQQIFGQSGKLKGKAIFHSTVPN